MSNNSIDLTKDKIRYLAIGDSIVEGFNSRYGVGFPGSFDIDIKTNKKKIKGMSYPSILAKTLLEISPDCLESFDNFALSGSRSVDWLYFLGVDPKKNNYLNSEKEILESQNFDTKENNSQKSRTYNQFGKFGLDDKNDFNKLKEKIKNANFITLTIGANDWIKDFPISEIISVIIGTMPKAKFDKKIMKINEELFRNIKNYFSAIIKLNPTANIVATNYTITLPFLVRLTDEVLRNNKNIENRIFIIDYIKSLNNVILKAATETGIHYINFENQKYWEDNIDDLSRVFFDIHPTYYGYKKIAQEIFLKTTLSNNFFDKSLDTIIKKLPNTNKEYLASDYKKFSNIIDFSKINITDDELIKISNISNEKLFWSDNSHEKEFLNLRRTLSVKKYFDIDEKATSSNNVKNIFKAILEFIYENNFDPENNIKKILENEKYVLLISTFLYKSSYLDVIVNQIQKQIDHNKKLGIKTTLVDFKNIVIKRLFNASNIFLLLKELSEEITKILDKEMIKFLEKTIISLLLNISKSPKYGKWIQTFIKEKSIEVFSTKFKLVKKSLIEVLVDNFVRTKLELIVINFIKTYFNSLEIIKNIQNTNVFLTKFIKNYFDNIGVKETVENIFENKKIEESFSEIIINILELKNYTKQDIEIFKKFFKLIISIINNTDIIVNVLSKFIIFWNDKNIIKSSASFLNLIWSFKSKEFWNVLKHSKITKMWTDSNDVYVLADTINLIYEKSSNNENGFYNVLMNIQHPKFKEKSLTYNLFNMSKDLLEKILKIENIYLAISNTLYNSYKEFEKINPTIKKEENPYYKVYYRFTISSLLIGYRMYQKDMPINIFWKPQKSFLNNLPNITNQIYRLSMGNTKNEDRKELVDYIFGETYITKIPNYETKTFPLIDNVLWYIQTSDSKEGNILANQLKKTFIVKSLKDGYWDKNNNIEYLAKINSEKIKVK